MKIDYTATDEQLLASGLDQKWLELSKQPFLRPGATIFDCRYALAVMEAKERRDLMALAIKNPGEAVHFPTHGKPPRWGFVPN